MYPCKTADPDLFFNETPYAVEAAKKLCDGCPIRQQCLEGAISRREKWGVWGGEAFTNGRTVAYRKVPHKRLTSEDHDNIVSLRVQRYSYGSIASKLGIPKATVRRHLAAAEVA